MLFYKAWRESQSRFLAGALALAGYCALQVWFRPGIQSSTLRLLGDSYDEYIGAQVFGSSSTLLFVLLVVFLGVGGLLRERAHHTAVFTLALPVARTQLVGAQVAVGVGEMALLALVPALLIQPLSAMVHQSYSMAEALRYSFLRLICGTFIFAISVLLSVVLRGEYTPPIACLMVLFLQQRLAWWTRWSPLRGYVLNPVATTSGRWQELSSNTIHDPLPWAGLLIMTLIAIALFAATTRITQRQNL